MDGSLVGSAPVLSPSCSGSDDDGVFDCLDVIRQFGELPVEVRAAPITRIDGRLLDRGVFAELISQPPPPTGEVGWSSRILKREESLLPHLGKILFCVLIRLPGVQYTMEVDPAARTIVHWEWQPL